MRAGSETTLEAGDPQSRWPGSWPPLGKCLPRALKRTCWTCQGSEGLGGFIGKRQATGLTMSSPEEKRGKHQDQDGVGCWSSPPSSLIPLSGHPDLAPGCAQEKDRN